MLCSNYCFRCLFIFFNIYYISYWKYFGKNNSFKHFNYNNFINCNLCTNRDSNGKTFEMTGYIPKYFYGKVKDMKSSSGDAHFWAFLAFLIFQIPFYILLIIKCKRERKPKIEFNDISTNTPSNQLNEFYVDKNKPLQQTNPNNNDPYYNSTDFNYNPTPLPQNQPTVEYTPPQQNYGYQNNNSQSYQPYQTSSRY